MPWTSGDVEILKAAILARKGARSITFSEQSVTFDSIDDMLKLLAHMEADASGRSSRTRYASTSKGTSGSGSWGGAVEGDFDWRRQG